MKKFEEAMTGKKVSLVSVSINSFREWKKSFSANSSTFQFLQRKVPNWDHYVMESKANPKLNNKISTDAHKKLVADLGVAFYPAYFAVDRHGKIIARPVSAVEYIRNL